MSRVREKVDIFRNIPGVSMDVVQNFQIKFPFFEFYQGEKIENLDGDDTMQSNTNSQHLQRLCKRNWFRIFITYTKQMS